MARDLSISLPLPSITNFRSISPLSPIQWQRARMSFFRRWMALGIRLSTVCANSPGPEQTDLVHRDLSYPLRSFLGSEGVVSRAPESYGGPSGAPAYTLRLIQTVPLPSSTPEPPRDCSAVCAPLWAVSACGNSTRFISASRLANFTSIVESATGLGVQVGDIPSCLRLFPR